MSRPVGVTVLFVLAFLLVTLVLARVSEAEDLEIFAGQDKNSIAHGQLRFNDARIIEPDPPDPGRDYTFSWDFDDRTDLDMDGTRNNDGESLDRYPTWSYDTPGIYIVTLTVSDGTNVAMGTLQVSVREDQPPSLQVDPYQVIPYGIPYQLNVTAHDDAVEDLVWEWDLGDGEGSTEPAPLTHTYELLGQLEVTVRVFDLAGNEASASITLEVKDMTRPRCDAGPDVTIAVNGTVDFDGTGSSDDIGITSWRWTFTDGETMVTLSGPAPNHTFYNAGSFVVGLRIQDIAGNAATDTLTVTVRSPGDANGGADYPTVPGPTGALTQWHALMLVVIVVMAFAVSISYNCLRDKRRISIGDRCVYFRRRSSR